MGGGVVRTAAKAAVLNAISRSAGRSQASSVATHQDPATVQPLSSATGASVLSAIPVETSSSEVDGWEFLGSKKEALFDAIHPSPRLVFGSLPTFEEAKEAASDLKDVLQMAYSSSRITDVNVSKQDLLCIEKSEEKDSTITSAMLPQVPKHVEQAFLMIQDNPEAQSVVASLVCDPHVWNAVENNPKFMNFIEIYGSEYSTTDYDATIASESCSYADSSIPKANYHQHEDYATNDSTKEGSSYVDSYEPKESMFTLFMKNIKAKASHFFKHLSDLLQDNNTAAEKGVDGRIAASFIGLAMAAIFIIIFKRG